MARKAKDTDSAPATPSTTAESGEKKTEKPKAKARRKQTKRKARASKRPIRRAATEKRKAAPRSRRGRIRYSDAQRTKILATAKREGLTGAQVRKRFGISTLTFYTWRKKAAPSRRGRRRRAARPASGDVASQVRQAIRDQVRAMLPRIIDEEVGTALGGRRRS